MDRESTDVRYGHHNKSQNLLRSIISFILAFLLSLSLTALTLLLVMEWSGFSRSSFYKNMSANNYYGYVKVDINNEAESTTIPIGLPADVLKNVFTSFKISQDVNGYIDAVFSGKEYTADTTEITKNLNNNIQNYFKKQGIKLTQEQENNIQPYTASIEKIYLDTVKMPLLSAFVKARTFYQKIFPIGVTACIIFTLICLFLIIRLHQWLHRALRYITYSTIAAGLMTGILPLLILNSGFYKKVNLSPQYFYNFYTDYVTSIFTSYLYFSVFWLVLSAILFAIINIIKNNRSYHKR